MSTDKTSLGDRMKSYEDVWRFKFPRRMPLIIRIDGRAFHTYTRGFDKPFSEQIAGALTKAGEALLDEVSGCKFVYIQSDEISILLNDWTELDTQPWFDKNLNKIVSISASIVTAAFNHYMMINSFSEKIAHFDSRAFVIPKEDVNNYFLWRQRDATRNSILGLGQKYFSHKQLHGKNTSDVQDMLIKEHNVNWNDIPTQEKRGWALYKATKEVEPGIFRKHPKVDKEIPVFSSKIDFITKYL